MRKSALVALMVPLIVGCSPPESDVERILDEVLGTPSHVSAAIHDMNGDALMDIVTTAYILDDNRSMVNVFHQRAGGSFTKHVVELPQGTAYRTNDVLVADLNLDGNPDVVVAHLGMTTVGTTPGTRISVVLKTGLGESEFGPSRTYRVGDNPRRMALADLDLDGLLDIAVATSAGLDVLHQDGGNPGRFRSALRISGNRSESVAVGDVDNDGLPDLLDAGNSGVQVHLNDPAAVGTFRADAFWGTGAGPADIVTRDFNGDGRLDFAVSHYGPDASISDDPATIAVRIQDPVTDAAFGPNNRMDVAGSRDLFSIDSADLNDDGLPDLVAAITSGGADLSMAVLLAEAGGAFTNVNYRSTAVSGPWGVVIGDIHADGLPDVVLANGLDGVYLHRGRGNGSFTTATFVGE